MEDLRNRTLGLWRKILICYGWSLSIEDLEEHCGMLDEIKECKELTDLDAMYFSLEEVDQSLSVEIEQNYILEDN